MKKSVPLFFFLLILAIAAGAEDQLFRILPQYHAPRSTDQYNRIRHQPETENRCLPHEPLLVPDAMPRMNSERMCMM